MTEQIFRLKSNLKCFSTAWEYNGEPHRGSIFAKTIEEAEEILKQRKSSEELTGGITAESCLNPSELEVAVFVDVSKT